MPRPQRKGPPRRTPMEALTDDQLRDVMEWGGYHPDPDTDAIAWCFPPERLQARRVLADRHPGAPVPQIGRPTTVGGDDAA